MLDMSTTAVNSALRRARSRLDAVLPDAEEITEPPGRRQRDLASRYATAFQEADLATLVSLLRADVIAEMPPLPGWFVGAAQVSQFFATHVLSGSARFALFPIEANGQLAFATYASQPDGTWEAHAIHVLEISGGQIARVAAFLEPGLFAGFGLRRTLTAPTTTRAAALTGGTA
jgi:RNA polymerase sigma-70 factor, ECF subfamily